MITTIYKCDRCGHEQEKAEQMWEVGVKYRHLDATYRTAYSDGTGSGFLHLWCRACCDALHIINDHPKPVETTPRTVTLEDQLREIIRQEIEAATGTSA